MSETTTTNSSGRPRIRRFDQVHFRTDRRPSADELAHVFRASGIKRPTDDVHRLEKMIGHANVFVTAWAEDELIGVARALSDFSYCCYVSDLAVSKDWQRIGVGKEIIAHLRALLTDEVAVILVAAEDAVSYYPGAGFERIPAAFKIPRRA